MPEAIGIDIGARYMHVAFADGVSPAVIPLTKPNWIDRLQALIPPGAIVALEPTGWYYSAPILRVLDHIGATALIVEHSQTGHVRNLHVKKVKTDRTDAHALRHIAATHAVVNYLGVTRAVLRSDKSSLRLRRLIYAYYRADKEKTRATNRLRQLAYAVHPPLGLSHKAYFIAVQHGFITPDDLRILASQIETYQATPRRERGEINLPEDFKDGRVARPLLKLIASLPEWLHEDDLRDLIFREGKALRYFRRQRREIEEMIEAEIAANPTFARLYQLWSSVPSSGVMRIAAVISATHGVTTIPIEQFRAALGVHPKLSQSGETTERVKSRPGFKLAKGAIHLWTMGLISAGKTTPNPIYETFRRHEARGHKGAFFAARAKLANILWGIARTGKPYDPLYAARDKES